MIDTLRASAFHARTAAVNRSNAWGTRNNVTLPTAYANANDEALAARTRVALTDLGARWQLMLEGPRVTELLQTLLTRDAIALSPSHAFKALWLADGGGVRGAAVVGRFGKESFWLLSASPDVEWLGMAAAYFDVGVRDISADRCGLAIIGPYAGVTLEAAGVQSNLEPLAFRKASWRGLEVLLSRFGEHGGYELWCAADDAVMVWDRIVLAGAAFGIVPVGTIAMDALDIEAGVPRPHRDYVPAIDSSASEPSPGSLGLASLIDPEHISFNGRKGFLATAKGETRRLTGVELDSDCAAPHTALIADGRVRGRTLSSSYSPSLRRAIALAQLEKELDRPGTRLSLTLPPSIDSTAICVAQATVADLPFLPSPYSCAP
jgi:aminomethyltransferase